MLTIDDFRFGDYMKLGWLLIKPHNSAVLLELLVSVPKCIYLSLGHLDETWHFTIAKFKLHQNIQEPSEFAESTSEKFWYTSWTVIIFLTKDLQSVHAVWACGLRSYLYVVLFLLWCESLPFLTSHMALSLSDISLSWVIGLDQISGLRMPVHGFCLSCSLILNT